ncbi:MAG: hypothetical protein WA417_08270 [Stellaceae bacterium]
MADTTTRVREDNPKTAYEHEDWRIGYVGLVYAGTFAFLVIAPLILMWVYSSAVSDVSRKLAVQPPAPELQVAPAQDLARFRAQEEKRLDTYYWVDKSKGIVHIPIEEAMKKLAKEGIAGFPKATTP